MRVISVTTLLLLTLLLPGLALAQQGKTLKIAILEFDPVNEEATKENLGRLASEFLVTAAVNSGSFSVVERAALKKVLDELQVGRGSEAPGSAAQAIGSMVGAQGVLTGSVAKTGNSVRLDARLIDVASGSIVAARSAYAKSDMRSLATGAELLVSQLEGDLARLTPAAAKPDPAKPDTARADVGRATEFAKPFATKPDAGAPDPAKPETAKPEATKPDVATPDAGAPDPAKQSDAAPPSPKVAAPATEHSTGATGP